VNNLLSNPIIIEDYETILRNMGDELLKLNGKSILITGATGMIGSYLAGLLLFFKDRMNVVLDIDLAVRRSSKAADIFGVLDAYNIVEYDANHICTLRKQYDYIIHAASLASPNYYGNYPVEVVLPNSVGLYNILSQIVGRNTRILFTSTGAVYGDIIPEIVVDEAYFGNLNYLDRGKEYSESKRFGELLCKAYHREYDLDAVVARVHHSYGPTMDYEGDSRVFSEFVRNAVNGEQIVIKGTGEEKRAFCYLSDLIQQLLMILIKGESGECYNVGNPYEIVTIRELAESISRIPQPKLNISYAERNEAGYCSSKIEKKSNYSIGKIIKLDERCKPVVGITEGFDRTIRSILNSGGKQSRVE